MHTNPDDVQQDLRSDKGYLQVSDGTRRHSTRSAL